MPATVSLFPVLLANFIATLGFSIVLPFLVFGGKVRRATAPVPDPTNPSHQQPDSFSARW